MPIHIRNGGVTLTIIIAVRAGNKVIMFPKSTTFINMPRIIDNNENTG
jgi:hypothetical protein